METYSYLTFLTSTVDFLSLCQGFIARKKWLNSQHLQWGHHQTWSAAVKPVPPFCRQWLTGVWLFVSLGWAGNDEPPALPWGDLWRRCISERGGASPGDRGRASCEGDGELHSHTGTGWSRPCQGLGECWACPLLCGSTSSAKGKKSMSEGVCEHWQEHWAFIPLTNCKVRVIKWITNGTGNSWVPALALSLIFCCDLKQIIWTSLSQIHCSCNSIWQSKWGSVWPSLSSFPYL